MAKLTNLQFWIAPAAEQAPAQAHILFDLVFTDDELLRNQAVDLSVRLADTPAPAPPNVPTGPAAVVGGSYRVQSGKYSLAIGVEPVISPIASELLPEPVYATSNGLAGAHGLQGPSAKSNGKASFHDPTPNKRADTEAAFFEYDKRITPSGRRLLSFRRVIDIPNLPSDNTPDEQPLCLLITEDLRLLRGHESLAQRLGLRTQPQRLAELLTPTCLPAVQALVGNLWRNRRAEELAIQFRATEGQVAHYRARFSFRDTESLMPEISVLLDPAPAIDERTLLPLLQRMTGNRPDQAVCLVNTEGVIRFRNPAFDTLFDDPTGRLPQSPGHIGFLKHCLEDRSLAQQLAQLLRDGQAHQQPVGLFVGNRSLVTHLSLEPLHDIAPGWVLLSFSAGNTLGSNADAPLASATAGLPSPDVYPFGFAFLADTDTLEQPNATLCQLTGYSADELVRLPLATWLLPETDNLPALTPQALRGLPTGQRLPVRLCSKQQQVRPADLIPHPTPFGPERVRLALFVQDQTETHRLQQQLVQHQEENRATQEAMQQTQEELQNSERRFRKLILHAPVGICITDPEGRFESVNQTYCNIYGYHEEDLLGKPFTVVVPKDKQAWWLNKHDRFIAGEDETRGEFNVIDSKGRMLTVLADSMRSVGPDGRPRKVTFVVDITDRKETEHRLQQSEQRLASLIESAPLGICVTNEDGILESINSTYCHIYGYTPQELIGQPFTKVVPPSMADRWLRTHERFIAGQTETRGEFTVMDKQGRQLTVLADSLRITGSDGRPKKVTFVVDITERKQQEALLRASEERLSALLNTAPVGICITDRYGRFASVNDTYCRIYGYHREDLLGQSFTKIVPASQAERWLRTHDKFLAGETETRGEFTVVHASGKHLTILADSIRIQAPDGQPQKVTFVLDITERKEQEAQLRASEERLGALINTAPIGICLTNEQGLFESVNSTYCSIYQYTPQELIGQSFTKVVPPEQAGHWLRTHERFIAGEAETRGEFTVIDKYGKRLTVLADSLRITGSDGRPKKVTFVLDITERKQQEALLRASEERLRTLIETAPVGICVTNERAEFESVNNAYLSIYGYTAAELIGKSFTTIVPPATRESWLRTHDKFLAGETHTRGEFEVMNKQGERIVVMADSARVMGPDGKPRKVTFVVDITQQKRYESQIVAANQSLEASKQELQNSYAELERRQAELQASKTQLELSKAQLEQSYNELATSQQALQDNKLKLEDSLRALEAQSAELARSKAELETSHAKLQAFSAELEASARKLGDNNRELEAAKLRLETSLSELEASQRELQRSKAELEANHRQLAQNNRELEANKARLEASLAELEASQRELQRNKAELEASHQLLTESKDELEARKAELEASHAKLQAYTQELSQNQDKLQAANTELQAKRTELENAIQELNNMQSQLVISEKMSALGQLIAGVAHEVNTPISAVKASVRNMMRDMPEALDGLPKLLAKIPKTQSELVQEFLTAIIASDATLTTKEERAKRMELEDILLGNDVPNAEAIADILVEIRMIHNIERYLPLFTGKFVDSILTIAQKLGQLKVNLSNIDLASEKTARIVKALKNYSYVQSTDRLVPTDLSDSVETILTLLHNQLKYGIEVVRQYADTEPIPIYPDELGQVWTNIITNAIQAMGDTGRITIAVQDDGDGYLSVSITDSGPGIPEEIRKRIFEPFFTTKPQGQGTGLGLDISKKIIEKHQGEILVDSEPGRTTFTVRLPKQPADAAQVLQSIPNVERSA